MVPIMAWRNIWRNPTRSMVVIIAIAMGIWAALFMSGFATGMAQSYIDNAISNMISHLQIHHPEFKKDEDSIYTLGEGAALKKALEKEDIVEGLSLRTIANGMIASSNASRGIKIRGIDPDAENLVTGMKENVQEGTYFEGDRKNQILISKRLAEKLNAKLRTRLVLTFPNQNKDITSAAFRVVGIYESGNNPFDEAHVFVQEKDLNRLIKVEDPNEGLVPEEAVYHEAAILLKESTEVEALQEKLQKQFPDLLVENYREIAPDVQLYESMIGSLSAIYLTIIMLALVFGIINTMLMAVLERVKELGMLMAIGMNKVKVFSLIVFETLILGLIGAPLGMLLGGATIAYISKHGLNLSAFSSAMKMYGLSEIVYFDLPPTIYLQVAVAVSLTALLASIYPALKAIRLKPIEAIRKI